MKKAFSYSLILLAILLLFLNVSKDTPIEGLRDVTSIITPTNGYAAYAVERFCDEALKYKKKHSFWPHAKTQNRAFGILCEENGILYTYDSKREEIFSSYFTRGEIQPGKDQDGNLTIEGCRYEYLNKKEFELGEKHLLVIQKATSGIIIFGFNTGEVKVYEADTDLKKLFSAGMTITEIREVIKDRNITTG